MKSLSPNHHVVVQAAGFLAICGITLFVFWPGLTGPFLFDDFPNLKPLAANGGITGIHNFLAFVLGGHAGPLGRPISLASFVLNDFTWPSDAWAFKYTNLLIHLLSGVFIFICCRQLGRFGQLTARERDWFALAAMALWLLHPLQISNIMLVVQRMNELSALFVLIAISGYLHGRILAPAQPRRGYVWMTGAIVLGLPLAVLSKENGVLLTGFILVIEATLLARSPRPPRWRLWALIFLVAPLLLLAAHFILGWRGVLGGYNSRDFTFGERLLTEPRILFNYLRHIVAPSIGGSGIFHDDYVISKGLFTPPATALALAGLAGALGSALWLRRAYPLWAFAVLWFLAGHVLESSFIGLELYFEHRNYLPILGPIFAAIYAIAALSGNQRRLAVVGAVLFISCAAVLSHQASGVWGSKKLLATVWAAESPHSARASQFAADYWARRGNNKAALEYLLTAAHANPNDLSVRIQIVLLRCRLGDYRPAEFENALQLAPTANLSNAVVTTVDALSRRVSGGGCGALTQANLQMFLDQLATNPKYRNRRSYYRDIWYAKGNIAYAQRNLQAAIENLDQANNLKPSLDIRLLQIGLLMSAGRPDIAQEYYDKAETLSESLPWYEPMRTSDLKSIHKSIRNALKNKESIGSDSIEIK